MTVSVTTEGNIEFLLAGKPDAAHKNPTMLMEFELLPKDFDAFESMLGTVSALFAK